MTRGRTPFLAGVSALALLAGSGAAIAATHSGSHHAKPAIRHATNEGTTTTTTPASPGAATSGHKCPDSTMGSASSSSSF